MPITPQELNDLTKGTLQPPVLPQPRGPLTEFLFEWLTRPVCALPPAPAFEADLLADEDAVLALYACYELHYRGFAGVDEDWEWEPTLLDLRRTLEHTFLQQLRDIAGPVVTSGDIGDRLLNLLQTTSGPSLSQYMATSATL